MNIFLLGYPIFRGYVSRECISRRFDCAGGNVAVGSLPIISVICSNSVARDNVEMTTNENGWDTTEVVVWGVLRMFVPVVKDALAKINWTLRCEGYTHSAPEYNAIPHPKKIGQTVWGISWYNRLHYVSFKVGLLLQTCPNLLWIFRTLSGAPCVTMLKGLFIMLVTGQFRGKPKVTWHFTVSPGNRCFESTESCFGGS